MADHDDIARGEHAQRLLDDPLLTEAFAGLRASYIDAWEKTPARDTDARERLWQAVQILGKVRTHLQKVASRGTVAAAEAAEDLARREREKILGIFPRP